MTIKEKKLIEAMRSKMIIFEDWVYGIDDAMRRYHERLCELEKKIGS